MSAPTAPNIFIRPRVFPNQARFYWQAPTSDGGSPITHYSLSCSTIPFTQDLSPTATNVYVSSLTNAIEYAFDLTATNAIGTSPASAYRSVQPGVLPFGPTVATASTFNESTALVTWDLSTIANEGDPKWFLITTTPSTPTLSTTLKSAYIYERARTFTGLSTNIYYNFLVQAINDTGYCKPFAYTGPLYMLDTVPTGGLQVNLDATTYDVSGVTTWYDLSPNGRDATLEMGAAIANASGNGIVLNGSTSWTFPSIPLMLNWTAVVWFKRTGPSGLAAAVVAENYIDGSKKLNLAIFSNFEGADDTQLDGGFYDTAWHTTNSTVTMNLNEWRCVAVSWDGTNLRMYNNSVLVTTTSHAGQVATNNGQPFVIGRSWPNPLNTHMVGEIGQVLIYNYAMSGAEVSRVYFATFGKFQT